MHNRWSVITEIYKRPFLRPLIFWIIGIVLQVCFPLQTISLILPVTVGAAILLSFLCNNKILNYQSNWIWGAGFALILVFAAIQTTFLNEYYLTHPPQPGILLSKAREIQLMMVEKLNILNLPDSHKSVLAAITVNYKQTMTSELRNMFSVAGVSHLLAVSGFHVGIVGLFANKLFAFLPDRKVLSRWMKYIAIMLCIWSFAYISGLTSATVRAAVMLTIYLAGKALGRRADKYNTLCCAAFMMLVYNPYYLFDIGFQLSYVAVLFILYLYPRINRLLEIRNPVVAAPWNVLSITVAAQIGTIFLCFFYFGRCSAIFLFTNVAISLIATVLIPATLIWMLLPEGIILAPPLQTAIEMITRGMMWIVDEFAALPYSTFSVRFDLVTMLLSYLCLVLVLLYARMRSRRTLTAVLLVFLLILLRHLV